MSKLCWPRVHYDPGCYGIVASFWPAQQCCCGDNLDAAHIVSLLVSISSALPQREFVAFEGLRVRQSSHWYARHEPSKKSIVSMGPWKDGEVVMSDGREFSTVPIVTPLSSARRLFNTCMSAQITVSSFFLLLSASTFMRGSHSPTAEILLPRIWLTDRSMWRISRRYVGICPGIM